MSVLRVAVAAGTSDATELITQIGEIYDVTAFTATAYGAEILKNCHCHIHVGRLNENDFMVQLRQFDVLVDATHPFAVEVSRILRSVCTAIDLPYLRQRRAAAAYDYAHIRYAASKEEAAEQLSACQGNILLTTGVNTLHFYEKHIENFAERVWARVLDTADSRKTAAKSSCHIVYAMPPFSMKDTLRLLQENQISVMVSKDSGIRGGLPEKLTAAEKCSIPVILIRRPPEQDTMTMKEITEQLRKFAKNQSKETR